MTKKNLFCALLVILVTTAFYVAILYKAESVDRGLVAKKIQFAYKDGQLLLDAIPFFSRGLASTANLAGSDQMVESLYARMVMYRDRDNRLMNALNPGIYQKVGAYISSTETAKQCALSPAEALDDPTIWTADHKPRFWHGVKAMLLLGFKYMHLSQITWLIKISTFFAFALVALQVMYIDRQVGLAYSAFTLSAFYCSSVFFFGGVAYSVPLLSTALWAALWLGFRMLPFRHNRTFELMVVTFGGTLLSFFYQLGGCEMYAISMIIFIEVFLPLEKVSSRTLIVAFQSCVFFLVGFFCSILLKHFLIVCLAGSFDVVTELIEKILYRMSDTNDAGGSIGFLKIIRAQFHWYGIPAYGIKAIYSFVNASKYVSLVLVLVSVFWLLLLRYFRQRDQFKELSVAFCGFCLMLAVVLLRYMVLRNHSDIHVFFVNRYLFVYAGTVYFYLVWLIVFHRKFWPRSSQDPNHSPAY
jgi:hypothetical protein